MKNKIVVLTVGVAVLCFSLWANTQEDDLSQKRYHEHLVKETKFSGYDYSKIDETTFQNKTIDPSSFSSHLPVLSFDTRGQEILGGDDRAVKDYIQVRLNVSDNKKGENTLSNETYSTDALIRYRGNSSRFFEKKGLRLKLVTKKAEEKPYKLLGLSEDADYALHGPYLDKTLLRNYLGYNITGEIMEYSPNVRFCEVFVNGEYEGVYLLVETIKVSKDRVNVSRFEKNSSITSYLLEIATRRTGEDIEYLNNFTWYTSRIKDRSQFNIKYPGQSKLTDELHDYINDDISYFERILYSYDYDDENIGYTNYIDIDSFVNYVVFNEFFMNYDAGNNSTYIYKDKTGKYKLAFWDMNNIFDNYIADIAKEPEFMMKNKSWFQMLLKDEYFTNRVISRYRELRKTYLSDEYLYDYIDKSIDYLGPAIERNFVRWGDSFTDEKNILKDIEKNPHSYEEAVDDLKDAITERGEWLDKHIESLKQFCHESKVKDYNP